MTEDLAADSERAPARRQLGTRLREARESRGLSADRAAYESGLKTPSLLRYERGERDPGALNLAALARTYGVCTNHLLGCPDLCTPHPVPEERHAVLDLDIYEALLAAATEADIQRLMFWRPPPVLAIVSIPIRQDILSVHDVQGIGSEILDKVKSVAPKTYKRWTSQRRNGADK